MYLSFMKSANKISKNVEKKIYIFLQQKIYSSESAGELVSDNHQNLYIYIYIYIYMSVYNYKLVLPTTT